MPKSPGSIRASPTASAESQSRHSNDGDGDEGRVAAAGTQPVPVYAQDDGDLEEQRQEGEHEEEQEKQQDWEQNSGDSGDVPPSRQSDVLLPTSPFKGLEVPLLFPLALLNFHVNLLQILNPMRGLY